MNQKSSSVDNMLLQELVRVKKIRFKDLEIKKKLRKVSTKGWQNHANFLEFQSIYRNINNNQKSNTSVKSENNYEKPKISGVTFNNNNKTVSTKVKKLPQFIETVNLELPIHYGADRAVQLIENKIRPKRQNNAALKTYAPSNLKKNSNNNNNKPKKRVVIVDQLNTIEEVKEITNFPANEQEIEEIEKIRKYTVKGHHKIYNKSAIPITRKKPNTKIMDALSTINEKLRKMQEKYFNTPKIHYKNTSDCCVQSNTVEILYENGKYPDKINSLEKEDVKIPTTDFESIFNNNEMQNRIKEMNDLFPEFPKIEETLKEIEGNLGSIILPENNEYTKDDDDDADSLAEKIVKKCEKAKENKIRFIRNQINEVEDFCDKLTEIAQKDNHQEIIEENKSYLLPDDEQIVDYNNNKDDDDDSNLQESIKKSNYLSKEFNKQSLHHDPMVKIFSDNKLSFWRNRMKELKKAETPYSVESVTKILDTLKFSLENSLYEPVT